MSKSVIDDTAEEQFVVSIDGTTARLEYKLRGDRLHLLHTEVPEAFPAKASAADWLKQR